MKYQVSVLNVCEAIVQLRTGKVIKLWHADGNVLHLVRELERDLSVNPDCSTAKAAAGPEDTQTVEVYLEAV